MHTLETLAPEMSRAIQDLEAENSTLEAEAKKMLNQIQVMVSDLSDLRYGHFSQEGLSEDAIESLKRLERLCKEEQG
jgi:hypothetical protein